MALRQRSPVPAAPTTERQRDPPQTRRWNMEAFATPGTCPVVLIPGQFYVSASGGSQTIELRSASNSPSHFAYKVRNASVLNVVHDGMGILPIAGCKQMTINRLGGFGEAGTIFVEFKRADNIHCSAKRLFELNTPINFILQLKFNAIESMPMVDVQPKMLTVSSYGGHAEFVMHNTSNRLLAFQLGRSNILYYELSRAFGFIGPGDKFSVRVTRSSDTSKGQSLVYCFFNPA